MKNTKKGVSPVIATVLLIAIVVVIALIIFLWFRGLMFERITKFGDENVELACDKVSFSASHEGGNFVTISNSGNVPIFSMKAKIEDESGHQTIDIGSNWPANGLNEGGIARVEIEDLSSSETITLIPVLLAKSEDGSETSFTCGEKNGYEISIQ